MYRTPGIKISVSKYNFQAKISINIRAHFFNLNNSGKYTFLGPFHCTKIAYNSNTVLPVPLHLKLMALDHHFDFSPTAI